MPLNRPALTLGPGPRGVQDARRWVVDTCQAIGRDDLIDCAELGVSELVTNALLHARPPITVRVRGTAQYPRVEVRDGSVEPPRMPDPIGEDDDLLLTFGRGLNIVARCSDAWGADIDEEGKVVWFVPAATISDEDGAEGHFTGLDSGEVAPIDDPVTVRLLGVPTIAYQGFVHHFAELRREVRLLVLSTRSVYPVAEDLAQTFDDLQRDIRATAHHRLVADAYAAGHDTVDLEIVVPRRAGRSLARFLELLDLADDFCRQQRLLSLARSPEQRAFQEWYLGEAVRQIDGGEPQPFDGPVPAHAESRPSSAS
ncbi:hypothetical protein GCM10022215_42720 [Nocardioides fonticola]|uniref:Histidine kinase/HSP90-like ATPase domain-containing protein n=1 Tax=Nocardioides fonticola TaxID=450363 RepID=A0ABP7Y2F9_9ACTN